VKPDARAIAEHLVDRFWSQFGPGKAEAIPMIERALSAAADAARQEVINLVRDDGYAMTFQSLGQYRTALLKSLRARDTGRQR
jgi:hypothetical protein